MKQRKFKNRIQNSISLTFLIIILVSCIVTYFTIKKIAYPILLKKERESIQNIGNSIVLELRNKIKNAETISLSIANIYNSLPKKREIFMKVIPDFFNLPGYKSIIAGGGVWPEPYTFNKRNYYNSFFWGRDSNGDLKYYDNYNNPHGKGYFHEEWYVPVKYLEKTKVYWSRSYIDPYSKQPMVTCSSPIKINKNFLGVATVDLKLEGLAKLFSIYAKQINGYIFVLDRENNFLYFPKENLIIEKKGFAKKYINFKRFAKKFPQYSSVEKELFSIDKRLIKIAKRKNLKFDKIVDKISNNSYQITKNEAILITTIISAPLKSILKTSINTKLGSAEIKNDLIFQESSTCSIFYMPGTYWKIGVVVPNSLLVKLVNSISWNIISYLLISLIIILLCGYMIIRKNFLIPLKDITKQLLTSKEKDDNLLIKYSSDDELGRLVYYLNERTLELKESEEYANAIFEQSPISIQIFDKNGVAIDSNKAWEELWKVDKKDFNGKYNIFKDKIFRNTTEFQYIKDVFNGKTAIINNFEYNLKTVSGFGRDRILNVIMFPIKDNNNNVVRVVIIQDDITDKVKMEETMKRFGQLEALGELSAGIAHDFNNILTGMLLNIEMLEITFSDNEKAMKFISKVKTSINSAKELINKIKMVSQREEFKFSPFKLNNVLKEAIEIVKPAIPFNIKVKVSVIGKNFWINGDKNSINQVIMNILINAKDAIKAANREKGLIDITLSEDGQNAILKISDNGVGIPKEIQDKIFEPFFSTKQKTEARGTGLGLSIAHNIILLHNGIIKVESTVGKGTIFTIELPLIREKSRNESKDASESVELYKELKGKIILLVEDEENIRNAEIEILKYFGFKVLVAQNGKEALEIFKSAPKVDIIFIDWYMPIMNGEKTILEIRKIDKKIPIFIISGAISEKINRFKSENMVIDIISKPFNKNEIILKLNLLKKFWREND